MTGVVCRVAVCDYRHYKITISVVIGDRVLQLELCSAASRATASSQTMSKKLSTESSGAGVSEEMAIMWIGAGRASRKEGVSLLEVSE